MAVIHVVSHTHWDREWYLTFQQFRIKLVSLIDKLLLILRNTAEYRYFMLDGQTLALQDYLEIRPGKEPELRGYIADGRISVGPWYCLPDEFLVSPEALVRNLLAGKSDALKFGACMDTGYVPDQFGHIGQMPQILSGFGINSAVAWRGIGDQPCELWWEAPDGSRVLLLHLRESYSNAVRIPGLNDAATIAEASRQLSKLEPFSHTGHLLLMNGTDHIEPRSEITGAIDLLNASLPGHHFIHSNLRSCIEAVRKSLAGTGKNIPVVCGELRSSRRCPVLPGTLSTHIWAKQRNHACETLLEKWADPLSAYAALLNGEVAKPGLQPLVNHAWRLLMQCHPHDSICMSSIDQVAEEMKTRFYQVEQIGNEVTALALDTLIANINTQFPDNSLPRSFAVTVFNPACTPSGGSVKIPVILNGDDTWLEISDEEGRVVPCQLIERGQRYELMRKTLDWDGLANLADSAMEGSTHGIMVHDVVLRRSGDWLDMSLIMDDTGSPTLKHWEEEVARHLTDTTLKAFNVLAVLVRPSTVQFSVTDVPGNGYRTYWLRKTPGAAATAKEDTGTSIENAFFKLEADRLTGILKLTDKRTGACYENLNRFVDVGDCGDVYNYCPPQHDNPVDSQKNARVKYIRTLKGPVSQALEVCFDLPVPVSLDDERQSRSKTKKNIGFVTRATITDSSERVDITTDITNSCSDHLLCVHFAAPFRVEKAAYDGHFEVVSLPLALPEFDDSWSETPSPFRPQRNFTDISDGKVGLMIASRGLRQAKAMQTQDGAEIVLALLRCTGWLSLDSLSTRKGHAGPPFIATPAAQMQGCYSFEYSIIPHKGTWHNAFHQACAFNAPMKAVIALPHAGVWDAAGSFIQSQPGTFVITAVKTAEDLNGLIVRGYNITAEQIDICIRPLFTFTSVQKVRLDETRVADIPHAADGSVRLKVGAFEIITLRFIK